MTLTDPRLSARAAAAAIVGGLTSIPIRIGISVTFSRPLLDLTYVEWNRLMVVPLALLLVAMVGIVGLAASPVARVGAWAAVTGLVGMLAGVVIEFWIFGGLIGDREGAIVGWMTYLLAGVLVHVIGMFIFGVASVRAGRPALVGWLALAIAVLHLLWIPASFSDAVLVADQALIGVGWIGIGLAGRLRQRQG
jgi:hypothetical protein